MAGTRLLAAGSQIRLDVRLLPGLRVPLRLLVETVTEHGLTAVLVSCTGGSHDDSGAQMAPGGVAALADTPGMSCGRRLARRHLGHRTNRTNFRCRTPAAGPVPRLRHTLTVTPTGAGTLVLDELAWTSPCGRLGRALDVVLLRRLVLRAQAARLELLAARAAALVDSPVVVATAVLRDGRLLIAQRTRPPALAGRWELPGGRVEPGESEPAAVRRECREELGVSVLVRERVGTDLPMDAGLLRVHLAELAPDAPEPRPLEHAALRWVGPDELAEIDWVDVDRAVLTDLQAHLSQPGPLRRDERQRDSIKD